jgi:hypothetical protein
MQIARTELGLRAALVLFYSGSRRSLHVHRFSAETAGPTARGFNACI